jgi:acyl-CoA thioesterase
METNAGSVISQMMKKDLFSQWLGITILEIREGYCRLQMTTREEMCNGFGIAHGGICYSFADTALAFASNSRGRQALSFDTAISHLQPLAVGTLIFATATEIKYGNRIAHYQVQVENEEEEIISIFKGTVFVTDKEW